MVKKWPQNTMVDLQTQLPNRWKQINKVVIYNMTFPLVTKPMLFYMCLVTHVK